MWEGVWQALVVARAAAETEHPASEPRLWREDVNKDGQEEILLCDGGTLAVVSGRAGRLLYAFDLPSGQCWVGNPALQPGGWQDWDEHTYRPDLEFPSPWLPDSATSTSLGLSSGAITDGSTTSTSKTTESSANRGRTR